VVFRVGWRPIGDQFLLAVDLLITKLGGSETEQHNDDLSTREVDDQPWALTCLVRPRAGWKWWHGGSNALHWPAQTKSTGGIFKTFHLEGVGARDPPEVQEGVQVSVAAPRGSAPDVICQTRTPIQ